MSQACSAESFEDAPTLQLLPAVDVLPAPAVMSSPARARLSDKDEFCTANTQISQLAEVPHGETAAANVCAVAARQTGEAAAAEGELEAMQEEYLGHADIRTVMNQACSTERLDDAPALQLLPAADKLSAIESSLASAELPDRTGLGMSASQSAKLVAGEAAVVTCAATGREAREAETEAEAEVLEDEALEGPAIRPALSQASSRENFDDGPMLQLQPTADMLSAIDNAPTLQMPADCILLSSEAAMVSAEAPSAQAEMSDDSEAAEAVPAAAARTDSAGATVPRRRVVGKRPAPDFGGQGTSIGQRTASGKAARLRACSSPMRSQATTALRTCLGHSLSPPELGRQVEVIGDGWGGGSSSYLATVTEADDLTFTVIRLSGPEAWQETHVLREHCHLVEEEMSSEHVVRARPKAAASR